MTQVATLRKILLNGNTITQRSALMDHQIMALPRRIADLKEEGFPVKSVMKSNPVTGQRYAEYSLDTKITRMSQLKKNYVYRLKNVRRNVFNSRLYNTSKGYFVVTRECSTDELGVWILMAGRPQIIIGANLTGPAPDFEIEYVGGME